MSDLSPTPDRGQFKLRSARDWGEKLERELARVRGAHQDADELSDHCVNFAITAWHMVEWVWAEIKDRHQDNLRFRRDLGLSAVSPKCQDFERWVIRERPEIAWCRDIANGAKHVHPERDRRGWSTAVSAMPISTDVSATSSVFVSAEVVEGWVAKVVNQDGERIPVLPAFELVEGFWTNFLYANNVASSACEVIDVAPDSEN